MYSWAGFIGHVVPGVSVILLSIWWSFNIFQNYYLSLCTNGPRYKSQPWYPGPYFKKFPVEAGMKIFIAVCNLVGIATFKGLDAIVHSPMTVQHEAVHVLYLMNGIFDVLRYKRLPLPDGIESATAIMLFLGEGFLFHEHLTGKRAMMDIQIHKIVSYIHFACALAIYLETRSRHSPMLSLMRVTLIQLQGTWSLQTAFVLYPLFSVTAPSYQHNQVMIVTALFIWHCCLNFGFVFLVGAVVRYWMKKRNLLTDKNYDHPHSNVNGNVPTFDEDNSSTELLFSHR